MRERREDRRKSFTLIGIGLLLILIFGGLFFPEVPNINTYISAKTAHNLNITKVKNNDPTTNNHPEGIVITEGKGNPDQVNAYIDKNGVIQFHSPKTILEDKRFIHVELKEENDAQDFAQSIDNAAIYIARLMHEYNIKPDAINPTYKPMKDKSEISKKSEMNLDDYFERYGYSSAQFFTLVTQYYYGKLAQPPVGLHVFELIIKILQVIAVIIGIILIAVGLFLPKKRWISWWDA